MFYDEEVNGKEAPLIDHVHETEVIWNERGRFVTGGAVIIEREIAKAGAVTNEVFRLVEEHVPGEIHRQLFRGNSQKLGDKISLDNGLREFRGLPEVETTPLDKPTLIRWDNVPGGYSDLAGALGLLDAINAEISYGRVKSERSQPVAFADSRLFDGEGRIDVSGIVPVRAGKFRELQAEPDALYGVIQPTFESAELIAWINALLDICLLTMGYSKSSYGRDEGGGQAESGRALRFRQIRTLLKKAGKDRMAVEAITTALAVAMAWAANASSIDEFRADVKLGDGLPQDSLEDAQEVNAWGDAISLEEKIRTRKPEWDEDDIKAEIRRIDARKPTPPPTVPRLGGLGGLDLAGLGLRGRGNGQQPPEEDRRDQ